MPTRSYQAQVMPATTFGLGESTGPVSVEITWPNGTVTAHEISKVGREVAISRSK